VTTRRRGISLRVRITLAFVGAALLVSLLVAGTTYALAERYLVRRRVDDAIQQSFSNVRFAADELALASASTPDDEIDETEISQLVDRLEARGAQEVLLITPQGRPRGSSFGLDQAAVPGGLLNSVEDGRVGYAFTPREQIVFGSPLPGQNMQAYFFYPLGDLFQTLGILSSVLIGVSVGAVLLAVLVGIRVGLRVVGPVRRAGRAARQVAEGRLETRLEVEGRDELAALATAFNEMASALQTRIERERRFVGDVSHELRTPLTTLRASADYLLEHGESLTPAAKRAAELLGADIGYLQRLVDDLLDLSRLDAGRVDMAWERLSIADLAREVVAQRTRAIEQDITVELEDEPERLITVADKRRLERVVGNLVDNALTHGQGRDVRVRVGAEDGVVRLSVEDHGPGVPLSAGTRIFDRFFKADPSRHRGEGRGSGLGLAIARENAHLHGGEIRVYNGRTGGAKFEFVLPRREESEV
jgi:two-component system sensor histidine kinase MtrB